MLDERPKGILRNRSDNGQSETNAEKLDRQEVIRNTRLNAQSVSETSRGDKIRAKIAETKSHQGLTDEEDDNDSKSSDHLQWDEINLYKTEQEKNATMKIDEPKTPYEGGFNPEGEYYKDDDDEEIPKFELGTGEFDHVTGPGMDSLHGGEVIRDEQSEEGIEPEESQPVETTEEKHKRFEEMRKAHYHLKGNALKQKIQVSDDEDE